MLGHGFGALERLPTITTVLIGWYGASAHAAARVQINGLLRVKAKIQPGLVDPGDYTRYPAYHS